MELAYKAVILFTVFQRIGELFLSKRNESYICAQGGRVLKEKNYIFMVLLHTTWLMSLVYLSFFKQLEIEPAYFYGFGIFFLLGQFFRLSAITTLGKRWSTRVMILPEAPVIKSGLFNYVRHPNYVGVVLEIFSLPAMAALWPVSIVYSLLNGLILFFRIRFEEKMLKEFNDYQDRFFQEGAS